MYRGATGTLLGIPMWQPATLDMAVKFYADVAATFPGFPIMVYANSRAFRFPFGVDFWGQVAPGLSSASLLRALEEPDDKRHVCRRNHQVQHARWRATDHDNKLCGIT